MSLIKWNDVHGNAFIGSRSLVTGGAGFIGSNIANALLTLGGSVTILDDLSGSDRGAVDRMLAQFPKQVTFTEASILDRSAVAQAVSECDYVFHEAAAVSVPESVEKPEYYHDVDVTGTVYVLEAARKANVKRLMFAASAAAYGNNPELPKVETMNPEPMSPYAAAKVASEAMLRAYGACYDLDTVSLRYFNVFGPGQNANSAYAAVIAAFANILSKGQAPTIFGDGQQSRDFVHIDNVVHANLLAARCDKALDGHCFNVAVGQAITITTLAKAMARDMGRPDLEPTFGPERAGDVKHSLANIDQAHQWLGYEPLVDFESGLRQTVQWYSSQAADA